PKGNLALGADDAGLASLGDGQWLGRARQRHVRSQLQLLERRQIGRLFLLERDEVPAHRLGEPTPAAVAEGGVPFVPRAAGLVAELPPPRDLKRPPAPPSLHPAFTLTIL